MAIDNGATLKSLHLVAHNETDDRSGGSPSAGPGALWGLGQIATYLGRSRETVRLYWQATKARAIDPGAATAGDALPAPDFLLPDNSNGIHDFFNVGGDRHVKDWWTLQAVRPAWRPEVIAVWASTTGRAVRQHGGYRLPVPHYLTLPALPAPLARVVDQVLDVPAGYHTDQTRGLHVRIWDGPLSPESGPPAQAESARRTVVLLAPAGEAPGFPHQEDELAGFVLDAGLLTIAQRRHALWFLQTPHHSTADDGRIVNRPETYYISFEILLHDDPAQIGELSLRQRAGAKITAALHRLDGDNVRRVHNPIRLNTTVADLEHLIGERLEIYPPGTQTADVIARWASGERPVTLAWDPVRLGDHLTHLPVLVDALAAARADLEAISETDGGRSELLQRIAVLRAAANWVADLAKSKCSSHLLGHGYDDDQLRAVHLDIPTPTSAQLALLDATLADDEPGTYTFTVLLRDLPAVAALAATLPRTKPGHRPTPDSALGDALADALGVLSDHFRLQIPHRIAAQHTTLPVRVDAAILRPGNGDQQRASSEAYLRTVAWWGPRPEHQLAADQLARLFFDHERQLGITHGYDPFGRLVVRCPAAGAFAVAWPTTGSIELSDVTGLNIRAFRRLSDGRVDLVPISAR
ncbi:hypothetical protein AB0M95_39050 [Sphaerisporangium sp. NPDC051017]|uniref:hypothetical protein n=1 Tax=Sphaerisporangium sp. NPDC051017 TaxID=3154636 RepID=UPI00342272B7